VAGVRAGYKDFESHTQARTASALCIKWLTANRHWAPTEARCALHGSDPSLNFSEIDRKPMQVEAHALGLVIMEDCYD
jgi:hypothetical protein